jgi:hypothetical protein
MAVDYPVSMCEAAGTSASIPVCGRSTMVPSSLARLGVLERIVSEDGKMQSTKTALDEAILRG